MGRADGDRLVFGLAGGDSLGFAGFGDPGGVPCLAFHGWSSSRLMPGWMVPPGLLTAAGVRMIGVDRPGYGLSSVPWVTGFSDWPRAVRALADHLGLGWFAVLAHSLGSAFGWPAGPPWGTGWRSSWSPVGMGPVQPGARFHAGSGVDNLY